MAQQKSIGFKGIQRALPQSLMPDGACQEVINLRPRKGAWRPVGEKKELYSSSFTYLDEPITFAKNEIFLHDIEGGLNEGLPNWIGIKSIYIDPTLDIDGNPIDAYWGDLAEAYLINPFTGFCTMISREWQSQIVGIVFLKRTMIVSTNIGVNVYLYSSGTYSKTAN